MPRLQRYKKDILSEQINEVILKKQAQYFYCACLNIYFLGWQEPLIGQFEHPHPQEDFPFFLLRIKFMIMAEITAISTTQIIIVAMFS